MEENTSPSPIFETDELNYVMVTLPIHPEAIITLPTTNATQVSFNNLKDIIEFINQASNEESNQASNEVNDQVKQILKDQISEHVVTVLKALLNQTLSSKDILSLVGLNKHSNNKKRHI